MLGKGQRASVSGHWNWQNYNDLSLVLCREHSLYEKIIFASAITRGMLFEQARTLDSNLQALVLGQLCEPL